MSNKRVYKTVTFPEDYSKSYEEFKADFEGQEIFLNVSEDVREKEFQKAYAIATKKDGDISTTTDQSKKAEPKKG